MCLSLVIQAGSNSMVLTEVMYFCFDDLLNPLSILPCDSTVTLSLPYCNL